MNEPVRLPSPERLRLRVEDFEQLEQSGTFSEYSKAELIDGEIYVMNAQYSRHGLAKVGLIVALANRLKEIGSDLAVYSEVSIRLADDSMPEPDIFLARRQGYGPVPIDSVALVIEVSDTTLEADLGRKADLYAAAGIPEYWVIDLNGNCALMHEHPNAEGYQRQIDMLLGEPLISATIHGLEVESDSLVG